MFENKSTDFRITSNGWFGILFFLTLFIFSFFASFFCFPWSLSLSPWEKYNNSSITPYSTSFCRHSSIWQWWSSVVEQCFLPLIHSLSFFKLHFCFHFELQLPHLRNRNEIIHSWNLYLQRIPELLAQ